MPDGPSSPESVSWRRFSAAGSTATELPTDVAVYGADIATETALRLIGDVRGKRVLELGCGAGHASVAFALQGAKVIAVDTSMADLERARETAEAAGVSVELEQANLAELAFVRADAIDIAFSAFALAEVPDLDRVFRQVHRVLRPEGPLVFSLPHPAFSMLDPTGAQPRLIQRPYHDPTPRTWQRDDVEVVDHPRTIAEVFAGLTRANFRVDTLLEPEAEPEARRGPHWADVMATVPATVIFRGRKQGL